MKRLRLLIALAIGIMASSSGVIQVKAATYTYLVDFSTKEVANFNDHRQTFNGSTVNLTNEFYFAFNGLYRMSSCPTAFTINAIFTVQYRLNGVGAYTQITVNLPDLPCVTTNTNYNIFSLINMNQTVIDAVVNDDANFFQVLSTISFNTPAASNGITTTFVYYRMIFDVYYEFDTTYLFNTFLADLKYNLRQQNWTVFTGEYMYVDYFYTTAGNDVFKIVNSNTTNISTTRKKYAVNYNDTYFRGISAGIRWTNDSNPNASFTSTGINSFFVGYQWNYYYLNVSNNQQEIVDAPTFSFVEEDCGSFLSLNVGCFVNNAFAYLTNEAPIISDAFTLLNAGIEMAAQTFGIIGNFADDNVFGVMVLAGFGFIAVKWFLKND